MIGEFEEIVLLAVGVLHGKAYGIAIKEEIEKRAEREISVGALQVTLRRLEKKGHLESQQSEPALKGGRPRLFFILTPNGKKILQQTLEIRIGFWKSLPPAVLAM